MDMAWHPSRSVLATVASGGDILLWARVYRENWAAFAPDFEELHDNYVRAPPPDPALACAGCHTPALPGPVEQIQHPPVLADSLRSVPVAGRCLLCWHSPRSITAGQDMQASGLQLLWCSRDVVGGLVFSLHAMMQWQS